MKKNEARGDWNKSHKFSMTPLKIYTLSIFLPIMALIHKIIVEEEKVKLHVDWTKLWLLKRYCKEKYM